MKYTTIILVAFLFTFTNVTLCQSAFYVSTTGNNSNDGSQSAPWQTIQYSLDHMGSNAVLFIASGVYNEKINIPANQITLKNESANLPVLDASGLTVQQPIITISNHQQITIDGLELRNNIQQDAQGILIDGSSASITIRNCKIHDIHFSADPNATVSASTNAQGIIVYGNNPVNPVTNLLIEQNELYNCRLGYSEGIAINGNVSGFQVKANIVHDLTNIGIDVIGHEGTSSDPSTDQARNGTISHNTVYNCMSPYATSGGIYIDGSKNVLIKNNASFHNGYGIEIGCENTGKTADSITVINNIFYDNEVSGIAFGGFDYPSGSGKIINSSISNNTCYFNDFSNSCTGELYLSYSENCLIENNIFYATDENNLLYAELTQPGITFNYNVFYSSGGATAANFSWNGTDYTNFNAFINGSTTNATSLFSNPGFVSASLTQPDFHLTATSPCIDAGDPSYTVSAGETDFYNELRIENGIIDCGADEFGTTMEIIETPIQQTVIFPNPANEKITIQSDSSIKLIELFSSNGIQLMNSYSNTISVESLPAGTYYLKIYLENNTNFHSFVKF